jgi:3-dehydroquinate dehydratase
MNSSRYNPNEYPVGDKKVNALKRRRSKAFNISLALLQSNRKAQLVLHYPAAPATFVFRKRNTTAYSHSLASTLACLRIACPVTIAATTFSFT